MRNPRPVHFRRREDRAACNLPAWSPAEELTGEPRKVTCGACKRTLLWKKAASDQPGDRDG
jgi:hypothetical protein